jgi:hypothetical protein
VAMEAGIQSMQKTLLKIEKLLGQPPKSPAKR